MNRAAFRLSASFVLLSGLTFARAARADDGGSAGDGGDGGNASDAGTVANAGDAAVDAGSGIDCAMFDTCDDKSIGDACTIGDAGETGFCAPATPGAACSDLSILCQPPLGSDAGTVITSSGDAGPSDCTSDPECADSDGGTSCGDAGVCTVSTCTNGGTKATCAAATYGCDNKQANAPCTMGAGTAGFCLPVTIDDGSVDELECDVDVAEGDSDCNVGGHGGSSAAIICVALIAGVTIMRRRRR